MQTRLYVVKGQIHRIVTLEDEDTSVLGNTMKNPYPWDKRSVIIVDGKMYPNNPELIAAWDDKIKSLLADNKLDEAWEVFLTRPNKAEYPYLTDVDFIYRKRSYDFIEYFRSKYDYQNWERREVVDLKYFIEYMEEMDKDWYDWNQGQEYIETDLYRKDKDFVRSKYYFKSREDFKNKLKRALIDSNFGSMVNDW